jgi:ankyrin repeat protein
MKRAIAGIIIFLTLGLCASIAIAWLSACFTTEQYVETELFPASEQMRVHVNHWPWAESVSIHAGVRWGAGADIADPTSAPPAWSNAATLTDPDQTPAWDFAAGWPMLCLDLSARPGEHPPYSPWNMAFTGAIAGQYPWEQATSNLGWTRYLPRRPMLPGLLINTLCYAIPWFIPFGVYGLIAHERAKSRARCGQCARCRYPLAKTRSETCPECGAPRGELPLFWSTRRLAWSGAIASCFALLLVGFALAFHISRPQAPLHMAAAFGDIETLDAMLADGADADESIDISYMGGYAHFYNRSAGLVDSTTPLFCAVLNGQLQTTRRLLEAGADPNWASSLGIVTPFHTACWLGDPAIVQAMLDHGADALHDPSGRGFTPASNAAGSGRIEILRILAESGIDLGAVEHGLASACSSGKTDVCMIFLDAGAVVTPGAMRNAAHSGAPAVFELMLAHGGTLNMVTEDGDTLLHCLTHHSKLTTYRERVLAAGVDINAQGMHEYTPLHIAAYHNDMEYVRFLLDHGADPTIATSSGHAPRMVTQNDEIKALLSDAEHQWTIKQSAPQNNPADDTPDKDTPPNPPFGNPE